MSFQTKLATAPVLKTAEVIKMSQYAFEYGPVHCEFQGCQEENVKLCSRTEPH